MRLGGAFDRLPNLAVSGVDELATRTDAGGQEVGDDFVHKQVSLDQGLLFPLSVAGALLLVPHVEHDNLRASRRGKMSDRSDRGLGREASIDGEEDLVEGGLVHMPSLGQMEDAENDR